MDNILSLLSKEDIISLRNFNPSKIAFSPKLDEREIVNFIGIGKKIKNVYPIISCPDGSIAPERTLFPDFDKVDKMPVK